MNLYYFLLRDYTSSAVCVVRFLLKNLWKIFAGALACTIAAAVLIGALTEPLYQTVLTYAVSTVEAGSKHPPAAAEVTVIAAQMLETDVLRERIQKTSTELSYFSGAIHAEQVGQSNLVTVRIQSGSRKESLLAAQALMKVYPELVAHLSEGITLQVVQEPTVLAEQVNETEKLRLCVIAGLSGGAAMCWLLLRIREKTILTKFGAKRLLDAPIAAVVDHEPLKRSQRKHPHGHLQVFSPDTSEAYREQINSICCLIEYENILHGNRVFLIASVGENEGKSTIGTNAAAMLNQKGKKTILLEDMVTNSGIGVPLTPKIVEKMLQQVAEYDYVLITSPPMALSADTQVLAEQADASVLVVRQDLTPARKINDAVNVLRGSNSDFLGVILNDMGGYGCKQHKIQTHDKEGENVSK